MHEYDAALKLLLTASGSVLEQAAGVRVAEWLDTEKKKVEFRRADLLGVTADGQIVHVELQAGNDGDMALRMAEYCLSIYREFRKSPKQIVLYVGEARMRMEASLRWQGFDFQYTLLDFRELDGEALLASGIIEDNLLAILARLRDQRSAIHEILERIASLDEARRRIAFAQFLIISGLRRLGSEIQEEAQTMPILNDILDHDLLGPAILKGREEGRVEGRREGRQEGLKEGRLELMRRLIEKRFGAMPDWVTQRLATLSGAEMDLIALRILDVPSLEDLFRIS